MNKIIVTVGISNSGKSTYAHQLMTEDPNKYVIVNRDKMRELLFGYTEETIASYYHRDDIPKREKDVTRVEDTLINEALCSGKIPIVDATHLKRSYIERFNYWNVSVEVIYFDIDLEVALSRNLKRTRSVEPSIIKNQYERFKNLVKDVEKNPLKICRTTLWNDPQKPPAFIFDIDGTLAHMNRGEGGRSPYDWDRVHEDDKDLSTLMACQFLNYVDSKILQPKIIICTGRDERARLRTEEWLKKYMVDYDELYIRKKDDMRADWIVKEEMWREIAKDYFIVGMFDDRLQVVRRARALGLKVFNVEYHNF